MSGADDSCAMLKFSKIYDISVRLGDESIVYPGDPAFVREVVCSIAESGICEVSKLTMSAHSGTHIDTPSHFGESGKRLDDFPPDTFIVPALLIEVAGSEITPERLKGNDIRPDEALLFKTANSRSGRCCSGQYSTDYVYLTEAGAAYCVQKAVRLVGIDYITVEQPNKDDFPAHHILLKNEVLILEGLNLREVPAGRYTLIALPLKIKEGEASPVRAILLA